MYNGFVFLGTDRSGTHEARLCSPYTEPTDYDKFMNGMVIKTEGSKVVQITEASQLAEEMEPGEEIETLDGGKVIEDVKMAEVKVPVEQFPVEVQRGAEYEKAMPQQMQTEEDVMDEKSIVEAVAKAVASELIDMKKEMAAMKEKMEKMSAEPAAEKTLPKAKFALESTVATPANAERYEMMRNLLKTKKSK